MVQSPGIPSQMLMFPVLMNPGLISASTVKTTPAFPSPIDPYSESNENDLKIEALLSELVSLHKKKNKNLKFSHLGNGKPGLLIQVPRAKHYTGYDANERKTKWLETSLKFISNNSKMSSLDDVTSWLLRSIYKHNPSTFLKAATDLGLHIVQKMNNIEAAAMWTEANVSIRSARIILSHLNQKFKHRVQVPLKQVSALGAITDRLQPMFKNFFFCKNDGDINKEQKRYSK